MPAHHWVVPGVGAAVGFVTGGVPGAAAGAAAGRALVSQQGQSHANVNYLDVQGGPPPPFFTPGAPDIDIQGQGFPPGTKLEVDPVTGVVTVSKRRRRRKRLLTCQDKADIAFLRGQLGGGEMGRTAISSLLSRCG